MRANASAESETMKQQCGTDNEMISSSSSSSSSSHPSHLRLHHSTSGGTSLHTAVSHSSTNSVLFTELPLLVVPPFVHLTAAPPAASRTNSSPASSTSSYTWKDIVSALTRLGLSESEIEATVAYRGFVIAYLLLLRHRHENGNENENEENTSKQIQHDIKHRFLSLYNPLISSSSSQTPSSKAHSLTTSLQTALTSESGRNVTLELMKVIAKQCEAMLDMEISDALKNSQEMTTLLTSPSFASDVINFSYVYNSNNIDGVHIPDVADESTRSRKNEQSVTVVYETFSRMNHSCRSNCVSYLEQPQQPLELAQKEGSSLKINWKDATPIRLHQMRTSSSSISLPSSSSSSSSSSSPFLRAITSLRAITANEELTISYLSSQLLMQSTAKRQEYLLKHWQFVCTCMRCREVDYARVLICPQCEDGRIFVRIIFDEAVAASDSSSSQKSDPPPFVFESTCPCTFSSTDTNTLLQSELLLEQAFNDLRTSISTSPSPLTLAAAFGVSMKLKRVIADLHWIKYEYWQLMSDLYGYLKKDLDRMDACKMMIWYAENVMRLDQLQSRETRDVISLLPKGFDTYSQASLLIDVTSAHYTTPDDRLSKLYLCTELGELYASFSEICWSVRSFQSDLVLQHLLVLRSIYFGVCAMRVYEVCKKDALLELKLDLQNKCELSKKMSVVGVEKIISMRKVEELSKPVLVKSMTTTAASPSPPMVSPSTHRCSSSACPSSLTFTPPPSSLLICTRCRSVRYCSPACQKVDWKTHKSVCKTKS